MKYLIGILLLSNIQIVVGQGQQNDNWGNYHKHISYLSSDSLEGRLTGSKGEELAAGYIITELTQMNISALDSSYILPFSYILSTNPHSNLLNSGKEITGRNVVAFLNNSSDKTIVIGAHYDHIGRNEHNNSSEMNSSGKIHNGADDNASGVASLLEIARFLSTNNQKETTNFIFAFFSGEEDGLQGSKSLAVKLIADSIQMKAMINLDMIGRLDSENTLSIGGIGTSPIFSQILDDNNSYSFAFKKDSSGIGPSDHTSFYLQDVPVLFIHTGTHSDYHKPSDDLEKINLIGLDKITLFIQNLVVSLSIIDTIPFTKTKNNTKSTSKYKVTLGIMPDYSSKEKGLRIDGVTEGKPAQIGGLEAGDVLLKIDDYEIVDIYSYMEGLSKLNPGQKVIVTILRGKKTLVKEIQLN